MSELRFGPGMVIPLTGDPRSLVLPMGQLGERVRARWSAAAVAWALLGVAVSEVEWDWPS